MWFKSVAQNIVTYSKGVLTAHKSKCELLIDEIRYSKSAESSRNKCSQLAELSFDMTNFEEIMKVMHAKLQWRQPSSSQHRKLLNLLHLIEYLIKYGAGGFIDEFRSIRRTLENKAPECLYNDTLNPLQLQTASLSTKVTYQINRILTLLKDKKLLIEQRALVQRIRQKVMQGKSSLRMQYIANTHQRRTIQTRIDDFLQRYFWKYTEKFDKKMDSLVDKVASFIDEFLDYLPGSEFEIDALEEAQVKKALSTHCLDEILTASQEHNFFKEKLTFKPIEADLLGLNQ